LFFRKEHYMIITTYTINRNEDFNEEL
jgi:hypothetical protein